MIRGASARSPLRHPMRLPGVQQQAHQGRRMAAGGPAGYGAGATPTRAANAVWVKPRRRMRVDRPVICGSSMSVCTWGKCGSPAPVGRLPLTYKFRVLDESKKQTDSRIASIRILRICSLPPS
jgi:hypothetical protein